MKKTLFLLFMVAIMMSACAPRMIPLPQAAAATDVPAPPAVDTQTTMPTATAVAEQPGDLKAYSNTAFGLGFQYPSNWYGPDEYVSDQTLRVAIGSDVVYPYGEVPEQPSTVTNSYAITIQYTKHNQNDFWKDTYQSLVNLKDGESLSGTRGKIIRIRQLTIGKFEGFEYIATLSDTAQTDHVYSREVMLVDQQSDLLTISGTPNNVEVGSGADWRAVFQSIDESNQAFFHGIVNSMAIK
jgi:hypothetical protein